MNIVICGSRSIDKMEIFNKAINDSKFFFDIDLKNVTIFHGDELGIDQLANKFGSHNGVKIKIVRAKWNLHGKSAGPKRNQEMINRVLPDGALLAIWDGYSHGTLDCIVRAHKAGLIVYVYTPDVITCALAEGNRISRKFQKR